MDELNISGAMLREMFLAGAALLERDKAKIDALNVFPVPDGDTGTNMCMTMQSAMKELNACKGTTVGEISQAVSLGALKGARGNSGVILSQLFRGFASALKAHDVMDEIALAEALRLGSEAAYKAVMRPKEGTMLTVSRMVAEAAQSAVNAGTNTYKLIDTIIESGDSALAMTPQLLPVLKEAGVVDSGGVGLMTIYYGFKMALDGEDIDSLMSNITVSKPEEKQISVIDSNNSVIFGDLEEIEFGYCTEFFIIRLEEELNDDILAKFRTNLMSIGDSVVVVHDSGMVKVHVHTNCPGKALQLALRYGEVDRIKIENMREQNRELQRQIKQKEQETAIVAVAAGKGIAHIFKDLSVASVIEGGQTMNPSVDTILQAIKRANARNVFILPNNSNIIFAAQQAAELAECNVIVVPTKTIMQGISTAMVFNPSSSIEGMYNDMLESISRVHSGAVTYAVRTTAYNGTSINEGDIIGILEGDIKTVAQSVHEASYDLLKRMIELQPEDTIITIFFGEDVTEEDAGVLCAKIQEEYPEAEIIVQEGGQPLYYYYFSVE